MTDFPKWMKGKRSGIPLVIGGCIWFVIFNFVLAPNEMTWHIIDIVWIIVMNLVTVGFMIMFGLTELKPKWFETEDEIID